MRGFVPRATAIILVIALASLHSTPSHARGFISGCGGDYQLSFARVLRNPGDAATNIDFAARAEACGDISLAFAALERAAVSNPGDAEAQFEFLRVRNLLMPATTGVTVVVGANYGSNPTTQPRDFFRTAFTDMGVINQGFFRLPRPEEATYDANITVTDERTILGLRWRSVALALGQLQNDLNQLDSYTLISESGPVFQLTPDVWMQATGGSAIVWIDDRKYYDDASAGITFGALLGGQTQTLTARYTWRNGNPEMGANDADVIDVEARLAFGGLLTSGDVLNITPRLQISDADGDPTAPVFDINDPPGTTFLYSVVRPLSPSDYTESGGRIAYNFPLFSGQMFLGAGISYYERWYEEIAAAGTIVGFIEDKRHDKYWEPTAHVVLPNFLGPNLDVRFDYRYERRITNATTTEQQFTGIFVRTQTPLDYENHVAGVHIQGNF